MSISFGLNDGIDWTVLSVHKLPSLDTLVLDPWDWTFSQSEPFQSAFAALSPQLDALALGGSDSGQVDFSVLLRKAENLRHLYVHTSSPRLAEAISTLPCSLETLRFASTALTPEQLAALLIAEKETPSSLRGLRRMTLPKSMTNGWDLATDSSRAAIAVIDKWCQTNKVELEFVEKGKTALEDWQPSRCEAVVAMDEQA